MSSKKRLCLRSHTNKRQSFDERICDDLCQSILKYLSPEDQHRLRSVSKQFQSTILSSEELIDLNYHDHNNLKRFEYILKKFPNIREIFLSFGNSDDGIDVYNQLFERIHNYCPNLINCAIDPRKLNDNNRNVFREKFASSLVSVAFDSSNLNEFLSEIKSSKVEHLMVDEFCSQLSNIEFKRLNKIEIFFLTNNILNDFEVFAKRNAKTIKRLIIDEFEDIDEKVLFKKVLTIIIELKNLIHLELGGISLKLNDSSFANHFRRIAVNCHQLKSLNIYYSFDLKNGQTVDNMLEPLKQFKQLKRLVLALVCDEDITNEEFQQNIDLFSFKAFKGFHELTHLGIQFESSGYYEAVVNQTIFSQIDTNLPILQDLGIHIPMKVSPESNNNDIDYIPNILSRLSSLQSIQMEISDENIRSHIKTKLIENCKRITNIELYNE